jgi:hypothetical protein
MKWYSKQIKEIQKNEKTEKKKIASEVKAVKGKGKPLTSPKVKQKMGFHNPVKQRNVNRPKTDSK